MKIQVITYTGKDSCFIDDQITLSSIHDAMSLDDFDINVIFLSDSDIWAARGFDAQTVDCIKDLESLGNMIRSSAHCSIVIVYPQNEAFRYDFDGRQYRQHVELKDTIDFTRQKTLNRFFERLGEVQYYYENTKTEIGGIRFEASFAFLTGTPLIKSTSGKAVAVQYGGLYLSTLAIGSVSALMTFLKGIGLIKTNEKEPAWMAEVNMFDDIRQLDIIRENKEVISRAEDVIAEAKKVLASNQRYKSILYTSGDELAGVVFEILEDLFGVDLSGFVDEKEEDFRFTVGEKVVIGEIKGVGHNVRSENVSQLDVHVQNYIDEHEDVSADDIVALLIMNHQNKKAIQDREPVHDKQIKLAERNKSLIVDTYELLKLYEKYKMNEMPRKECVAALMDNTGLFKT